VRNHVVDLQTRLAAAVSLRHACPKDDDAIPPEIVLPATATGYMASDLPASEEVIRDVCAWSASCDSVYRFPGSTHGHMSPRGRSDSADSSQEACTTSTCNQGTPDAGGRGECAAEGGPQTTGGSEVWRASAQTDGEHGRVKQTLDAGGCSGALLDTRRAQTPGPKVASCGIQTDESWSGEGDCGEGDHRHRPSDLRPWRRSAARGTGGSYAATFAFVDEPPCAEWGADVPPVATFHLHAMSPPGNRRWRRNRPVLRATATAAAAADPANHSGSPPPASWPLRAWALEPARSSANPDVKEMVDHAAYCPALPWRITAPEDMLPAALVRRAALLAAAATSLGRPQSPPSPSHLYTQLSPATGDAAELAALWLRQLAGAEGGSAFERMSRELRQLNALYATALQQAAALLQARSQGMLPDVALKGLQGADAAGLLDTIAAMDIINGFEPVAKVGGATDELGCVCRPLCPPTPSLHGTQTYIPILCTGDDAGGHNAGTRTSIPSWSSSQPMRLYG
jgi:hypothetical protein